MNLELSKIATNIKKPRIYFIDNIRLFLTVLVVLHHIAITYGSSGGWYYYEHTKSEITNTVLSLFTSMNQMFFMGLFFLISGYFTPPSYNRKGFAVFIKDRFIRFGVPLVLFVFTVIPVLEYIKYIITSGNKVSFGDFYNYNVLQFRNLPPGHLWFIEVLLVFSIFYALIRLFIKNSNHEVLKNKILLSNLKIIIFVIFLALFTFLTRIYFKMGEEVFHFQVAYFPQYISLFIIGIIAYHHNWLLNIKDSIGKTWIVIAIADFLLCEIGVGALGLYGDIKAFQGGFSLQSLFLSFHQAFFCAGMCISMLYIFQKRYDKQGRISKTISGDAYNVYIIHAPIVVFVAILFKGILLHPLIKFIIVSLISLLICFAISHYLIKKVNGRFVQF